MNIEKDVPQPKERKKYQKKEPRQTTTSIVKSMSVGDSVLVETLYGHRDSKIETMRRAFRRLGMRSTCRKVDGGVRIWRTE